MAKGVLIHGVLVLILLTVAGCATGVSQERFDKLENELAEAIDDLDAAQRQIKKLQSYHEQQTRVEKEQGPLNAEWDAVQVAIDVMMADRKLTEINAGVPSAKITSTFDFGVGAVDQTLREYLRDSETRYCYTWDSTGRVLSQSFC